LPAIAANPISDFAQDPAQYLAAVLGIVLAGMRDRHQVRCACHPISAQKLNRFLLYRARELAWCHDY
jgi:hypothetical protein